MENANSSPAPERPAREARRRIAGERQSYMLLAFGILIAVVFPYFLRPRAAISSATPMTATASAGTSRADR